MTQPLGGPLQIMNRSQTFGQLEFDFDCDSALIFFPLEVRKYFSGFHSGWVGEQDGAGGYSELSG